MILVLAQWVKGSSVAAAMAQVASVAWIQSLAQGTSICHRYGHEILKGGHTLKKKKKEEEEEEERKKKAHRTRLRMRRKKMAEDGAGGETGPW